MSKKEILAACFIVALVTIVTTLGRPKDNDGPTPQGTPIPVQDKSYTDDDIPSNVAFVGFTLHGRYQIPNGQGAEILALSPDGNILAYTNGERGTVDFVDVSDPANPTDSGAVDVVSTFVGRLAEPTSLDIAPDGTLLAVSVKDTRDPIHRADPGRLFFVDMRSKAIVGAIELGVGPDSVKISKDGRFVLVAIEDEEDESRAGQEQQRPGSLQIVTINYQAPSKSTVYTVPLLPDVGNNRSDAQPEYVDIDSKSQTAVVSMQENNSAAVIDLATSPPKVRHYIDLGVVLLHETDVRDDGEIQFSKNLIEARREPDALCILPTGNHFITANEGDTSTGDFVWQQKSGGAGFTVFTMEGEVAFDSGNQLEHIAIRNGMYPDSRSADRGIEVEGCHITKMGGRDIAVLVAERASFVAIYDVTDPERVEFVQLVPSPSSPESSTSDPKRGLLYVGGEGVHGGGGIWVYRLVSDGNKRERYEQGVFRAMTSDDQDIPFGGISGVAWSGNGDVFYATPDAAFATGRIWTFTLDRERQRFLLTDELRLWRSDGIAFDGYDAEALSLNPEGGFILAAEGRRGNGCTEFRCPEQHRNRLLFFDEKGILERGRHSGVLDLPQKTFPWELIPSQGLASVSAIDTRPGRSGGVKVYTAMQEPLLEGLRSTVEAKEHLVRIAELDIDTNRWRHFYYPLQKPRNGITFRLTDFAALGKGRFVAIEQDGLSGSAATLKRVYEFSIAGVAPNEPRAPLTKTLVSDLLDRQFRFDQPKVDAIAATPTSLLVVNDNDGGESATFAIEIARPD